MVTEIQDWNDLAGIGGSSGNFVLANDLDKRKDGYSQKVDTTNGWEPITGFSGTLDGGGHEIRDLKIDRPSESDVGIFGNSPANLTNITVKGATVIGGQRVGTLAGGLGDLDNSGSVEKCSVYDSTVTIDSAGGTSKIGGLIGEVPPDCPIKKCGAYRVFLEGLNSGSVDDIGGIVGHAADIDISECFWSGGMDFGGIGGFDVGGVVGRAKSVNEQGIVENCASHGMVGSEFHNNVGGLIGKNAETVSFTVVPAPKVEKCYTKTEVYYADSQDSDVRPAIGDSQTKDAVGSIFYDETFTNISLEYKNEHTESLTSAEITGPEAETNTNLDFQTYWKSIDGDWTTYVFDGHPILQSLDEEEQVKASGAFANIESWYQLNRVGDYPDKNWYFNADVDSKTRGIRAVNNLNGETPEDIDFDPEDKVGWQPITEISGNLDGKDHHLGPLYYDQRNSNVAFVENNTGTIENLKVDVSVSGSGDDAAGIALTNNGNILDCWVAGNITAEIGAGGIAKKNNGDIKRCFSGASISATSGGNAGGIAVQNWGRMNDCYTAGSVDADFYAAGIAEFNGTLVQGCYSLSDISGNQGAAGIVRDNDTMAVDANGTIDLCWFAGTLASTDGSVGGVTASGDGAVEDSFWDTEKSGTTSTSGSATGYTTSEITGQFPSGIYIGGDNTYAGPLKANQTYSPNNDYVSKSDGYPIITSFDFKKQLEIQSIGTNIALNGEISFENNAADGAKVYLIDEQTNTLVGATETDAQGRYLQETPTLTEGSGDRVLIAVDYGGDSENYGVISKLVL